MDLEIEKCWAAEDCKAPLCPLTGNVELCIWYPYEDICHRRAVPLWVKNQKRIVKVVGKSREVGFFNVARLRNMKVFRKGIKGLDPDSRVFRRRGSTVSLR